MKDKRVSGFSWNFLENIATQGIQFIVGIVMARLLTPDDYGLIGILMVFISISTVIMDAGFIKAVMQKTDRTDDDFCTAFFFNMGAGLLLFLLLCLCSPLIAQFYEKPILSALTKVVALQLVINSILLVQRAKFTIALDFRTQAIIALTAALIQGAVGITMAYSGCGVWSIAWSGVAGATANCLLYWVLGKWRPKLRFSHASFKEMFSYGSKLLVSQLLDVTWKNIYPLIIGKRFPAAELGFYSRANHYVKLPSTTFSGVIERVTFPMLVEVKQDDATLHRQFSMLFKLSAYIFFPLMAGFAILARPLIIEMLTAKWEPCIIYLQILCMGLILYPIHALNMNLLQVKGRSDLFLRVEIIKKAVDVTVLLITVTMGVKEMCIGLAVASYISWIINAYYTGKLINIGFLRQTVLVLPTALYTLLMWACIEGVKLLITNYLLQLLVGIVVGVAVYYLSGRLLKSEELAFVERKAREQFSSKASDNH